MMSTNRMCSTLPDALKNLASNKISRSQRIIPAREIKHYSLVCKEWYFAARTLSVKVLNVSNVQSPSYLESLPRQLSATPTTLFPYAYPDAAEPAGFSTRRLTVDMSTRKEGKGYNMDVVSIVKACPKLHELRIELPNPAHIDKSFSILNFCAELSNVLALQNSMIRTFSLTAPFDYTTITLIMSAASQLPCLRFLHLHDTATHAAQAANTNDAVK